jgi:hypothetical protein
VDNSDIEFDMPKLQHYTEIPTVTTGTPLDICNFETNESRPPRKLLSKGIPMTDILVSEAIIPGR